MQNEQKENHLIIDMRNSTRQELLVLSTILLNLNTLLACHNFSVTVKKTKPPARQTSTLS